MRSALRTAAPSQHHQRHEPFNFLAYVPYDIHFVMILYRTVPGYIYRIRTGTGTYLVYCILYVYCTV